MTGALAAGLVVRRRCLLATVAILALLATSSPETAAAQGGKPFELEPSSDASRLEHLPEVSDQAEPAHVGTGADSVVA